MKTVLEQNKDLESSLLTTMEENAQLKTQLTEALAKVEMLEEQNAELETACKVDVKDYVRQSATIAELQARVKELESDNSTLEQQVTELSNMIQDIDSVTTTKAIEIVKAQGVPEPVEHIEEKDLNVSILNGVKMTKIKP